MELNDVMRTTFSARDYTGDPVPDEVIYGILDIARFAPSGGNRQGNRVIIVRDQETRDRISKIAEQPAKIYAAQRDAGESPWNTSFPPTSRRSGSKKRRPSAFWSNPTATPPSCSCLPSTFESWRQWTRNSTASA